jgi:hypothetical protein
MGIPRLLCVSLKDCGFGAVISHISRKTSEMWGTRGSLQIETAKQALRSRLNYILRNIRSDIRRRLQAVRVDAEDCCDEVKQMWQQNVEAPLRSSGKTVPELILLSSRIAS